MNISDSTTNTVYPDPADRPLSFADSPQLCSRSRRAAYDAIKRGELVRIAPACRRPSGAPGERRPDRIKQLITGAMVAITKNPHQASLILMPSPPTHPDQGAWLEARDHRLREERVRPGAALETPSMPPAVVNEDVMAGR